MDFYGPPLPPGFQNEESESDDSDSPKAHTSADSDQSSKSKSIIGPALPSFLTRERDSDSDDERPPKIQKRECFQASSAIGPVLPPELQKSFVHENDSDLPYGPVPISSGPRESVDDLISTIEKRAKDMRQKLDQSDTAAVEERAEREEWMTVPDTSRKNQLGAISRCLAPGSQKAESKHKKHHSHTEKDKRTAEELKKYNKSKRSESLLDMHKKDKKKRDKKSSEPVERKAFDREEMAVRHFNKDQVNSVIDKAKYLNSRFKPGASHYL